MKTCSRCHIERPMDEFYDRPSGSVDGKEGVCKPCKSDREKARNSGAFDIAELLRNWIPV